MRLQAACIGPGPAAPVSPHQIPRLGGTERLPGDSPRRYPLPILGLRGEKQEKNINLRLWPENSQRVKSRRVALEALRAPPAGYLVRGYRGNQPRADDTGRLPALGRI